MAELTVTAPAGAHFELEEVKTAKGTQSLGEVPILVWDDLNQMVSYYGEQGVLDVADGTSLRVSFQNIARRFRAANKSLDEIATAQVNFKPGKRQAAASTPVTRAAKAAKTAAEKGNAEAIETLLQKIAAGEIDVEALVAQG